VAAALPQRLVQLRFNAPNQHPSFLQIDLSSSLFPGVLQPTYSNFSFIPPASASSDSVWLLPSSGTLRNDDCHLPFPPLLSLIPPRPGGEALNGNLHSPFFSDAVLLTQTLDWQRHSPPPKPLVFPTKSPTPANLFLFLFPPICMGLRRAAGGLAFWFHRL